MEWGCMQALIDFDGWRKWKDFSKGVQDGDGKKTSLAGVVGAKTKVRKNRSSLTSAA